jgi:hypothetical protein
MNEQSIATSSSTICTQDLLTSYYDVTRTIFRHLPIRSVETCALVCQSWAHMSQLVKPSRHTIHALTYPSNLSSSINHSNLLDEFDTYMRSFMADRLWSIPSMAFIVITNTLHEQGLTYESSSPTRKACKRSCRQTATRRTERMNIVRALSRHMNRSCRQLLVASSGIITSTDQCQSNEIESGSVKRKSVIDHIEIFDEKRF